MNSYHGSMNGGDFKDDLYDGASSIGVATATIGLVVGILMAMCLCSVGGYFVFNNDDADYIKLSGKIVEASCPSRQETSDGKTTTVFDCTLKIAYTPSGTTTEKTGVISITGATNSHAVGEIVNIDVSKTNSDVIRLSGIASRTIGFILSSVAIVIVVTVAIHWYVTSHSKAYAALTGATATVNAVKKVF